MIPELHGTKLPPSPGVMLGTAGWPDDAGEVIDLADASNDGSNLVKVTLFDASHLPDRTDDTQARGSQIRCRLADNVEMPDRGTTVVVAIPAPFGMVPGVPIVIATLRNDPGPQANLKGGEKVITAPDGRASIYLRKGGKIIFRVVDDAGNASIFSFAPQSWQIVDPAYRISADTTGIRIRSWIGCSIRMGGAGLPSPLASLGSYITLSAGITKNDAPLVLLGPDLDGAAVYLPAAYGPDPAPAPLLATGIKSTCVKFSTP